MTVRMLANAPSVALAAALERFESGFTYPLGADRSFRISHGSDYPRFFRAIGGGSAACFVAVRPDGEVAGTLGAAVRPLQFPDGQCRLAAYLGDLRTAPGPARGRVLLQLSAAATAWSKAEGAVVAYGVVMGGTKRLPSEYTGRFGMHAFAELHHLCVLRLPAVASEGSASDTFIADAATVEKSFRSLSQGLFAPLGGSPRERSANTPLGLLAADHSACGILEDTRLAKRLIGDDGEEMLSAHLSQFSYRDTTAGARLLRAALDLCARRLLAPAIFVAVPAAEAGAFLALLGDFSGIVQAPATVYGTEFSRAVENWRISTAEI